MASTSGTSVDTTSFGKNRLAFALDSAPSNDIVADPHTSDEVTIIIWQRQMLIPFAVDGTVKAFLGPYFHEQPVEIQDCFPFLTAAMPPAFKKDIILDFKYMSTKNRVFRSMPTPGNKEYLAWLAKVQRHKQEQWKKIGIFDLIQLSRTAHKVNPCLLLAFLHFWEASTNTF